jgi:antirestriction protein ArdC
MSKEFKPLPEQISEKMIAAIKDGKSIFQKPMNDTTSQFVQPFNASTGKKYSGPAALILMMQDKEDPRWMTANQASFNKTHVLKESKGTLINFFSNNITRPVMENGEQVKKENGFPKTERVTLDKPQLVDAWLFNGNQLKDMPEYQPEPQLLTPIERMQNIMNNSNAIFENAGMLPDYDRETDTVRLFEPEEYDYPELYYASAMEQMLQWTAHESRLNRPEPEIPEGDVGLRNELRVNLAAIMLSAELDLPYSLNNNSVYLEPWAELLKKEPKELFKAAADAQKMTEFLLAFEPKLELENEVKAARSNPDKLEKGDVINYNEAEYTVLRPLKNKVFEMEKDGEKFKLSSKDNLYNSLLDAKKNPQEVQREQGQEQELEPAIAEEETSSYKMKR